MDYQLFVNKQAITGGKDTGVVLLMDDENITIKFDSGEKTYKYMIAFKSGFLRFSDEKLNKLMEEEISDRDNAELNKQKTANENNEETVKIVKKANEEYEKLNAKNNIMLKLFGSDFEYPPYVEFMKKYGNVIKKRRGLSFSMYDYKKYL